MTSHADRSTYESTRDYDELESINYGIQATEIKNVNHLPRPRQNFTQIDNALIWNSIFKKNPYSYIILSKALSCSPDFNFQMSYFIDWTGKTKETVNTYLKPLVKEGYLHIEQLRGKNGTYSENITYFFFEHPSLNPWHQAPSKNIFLVINNQDTSSSENQSIANTEKAHTQQTIDNQDSTPQREKNPYGKNQDIQPALTETKKPHTAETIDNQDSTPKLEKSVCDTYFNNNTKRNTTTLSKSVPNQQLHEKNVVVENQNNTKISEKHKREKPALKLIKTNVPDKPISDTIKAVLDCIDPTQRSRVPIDVLRNYEFDYSVTELADYVIYTLDRADYPEDYLRALFRRRAKIKTQEHYVPETTVPNIFDYQVAATKPGDTTYNQLPDENPFSKKLYSAVVKQRPISKSRPAYIELAQPVTKKQFDDMKTRIQGRMPGHSYKMWIEPLELGKNGNIKCPNAFSRKKVLDRYIGVITACIGHRSGGNEKTNS